MTINKLNFESENLLVDWISFKFQYLYNHTMIHIANYLLKIEFNSYQESKKLAKSIKEWNSGEKNRTKAYGKSRHGMVQMHTTKKQE